MNGSWVKPERSASERLINKGHRKDIQENQFLSLSFFSSGSSHYGPAIWDLTLGRDYPGLHSQSPLVLRISQPAFYTILHRCFAAWSFLKLKPYIVFKKVLDLEKSKHILGWGNDYPWNEAHRFAEVKDQTASLSIKAINYHTALSLHLHIYFYSFWNAALRTESYYAPWPVSAPPSLAHMNLPTPKEEGWGENACLFSEELFQSCIILIFFNAMEWHFVLISKSDLLVIKGCWFQLNSYVDCANWQGEKLQKSLKFMTYMLSPWFFISVVLSLSLWLAKKRPCGSSVLFRALLCVELCD